MISMAAAVSFAQDRSQTVNAMIGDRSYAAYYGHAPGAGALENARLQAHLHYVESLLRSRNTDHLTARQKKNRTLVLELLHQYRNNGIFPKNYKYEGRRPCFIDEHGNICAVGYLIEKTAGRAVAEKINAEHQYDYLMDMNEPVIAEWASAYGLTLEECATIQPSYGNIPTDRTIEVPIKPAYGIGSGFVGGVNVGLNVIQLRGGRAATKALSYAGLVTGTTQIVMGLANIRKDDQQHYIVGTSTTTSYKAQNTLSYLNIAAGTTTLFTSALNLYLHKKMKDKRNAFNLYSYPGMNQQLVAGLAFTRSL